MQTFIIITKLKTSNTKYRISINPKSDIQQEIRIASLEHSIIRTSLVTDIQIIPISFFEHERYRTFERKEQPHQSFKIILTTTKVTFAICVPIPL